MDNEEVWRMLTRTPGLLNSAFEVFAAVVFSVFGI